MLLSLIGATLLPFAAPPSLWPRLVALLLLGWALPGLLLIVLWQLWLPTGPVPAGPTALISLNNAPAPRPPTLWEWVALGAGVGWGWFLLGALLAHWLPGPITLWMLLAIYAAGAAALALPASALPWPALAAARGQGAAALLALLVIAGMLRLPGLGYHEFHFDAAIVLIRAREAIRGEDDALARHTKGPGEIAAALAVYRALGTANETAARLPFALASIGSVLGLAVAGRRLFGWMVGWWGGLLLALNGFALGLSRLVQYQPAVLLLTILAVWAAWEFARGGGQRWLLLAATFAAFGLVMHYEVALLAPALLWLTWQGGRTRPAATARSVLGAGGAGTLLLAATYLPTLLHPYAATTRTYLTNRVGALGTWNGPFFVEMGTFYNSIYFFAGLLLLAGVGLALGWQRRRAATVLLLLWFAFWLVLYLFVMRFPGTHFYLLMPAWSLLAALAIVTMVRALPEGLPRAAATILLGLWLALSVGYLYLVFFRQTPEYVVNYESARLPLYWAPYGPDIPEKPRFGLPLFEGWQTLGVLNEWHYLGERYATNERSRHLRWYLGGLERVGSDEAPDLLFVATHLQEPDPDFDHALVARYHPVGEVRVRGEPRLRLFSREPPTVPYLIYDAENFRAIFTSVVPPLPGWPTPPHHPRNEILGGRLRLTWLTLTDRTAAPGETLHLAVRWEPIAPIVNDWKLFVHLGAAPIVAQWDGLPGQGTARSSQWGVGTHFDDEILLPIPTDTPPGHYPLRLGLYDPATGHRLPIATGGDTVDLGTVTVGRGPFVTIFTP